MNIQQIYGYYGFGYNHCLLSLGVDGRNAKIINDTIHDYFDFLERNRMDVTLGALNPQLTEFSKEIAKKSGTDAITKAESDTLSKIVKGIDKTLDAELKLREAYILTEKRFQLNHLVSGMNKLFASDVFGSLPDLAKFDFNEAGKCIAFERPTAAAFHILRGTEATLKVYYQHVVKRKRIPNLTWGPIIVELRTKRKCPRTLLDNLDNIRINFRNPTSHPEAKYTLDEVQDLLGICIDAVNRLRKEIEMTN